MGVRVLRPVSCSRLSWYFSMTSSPQLRLLARVVGCLAVSLALWWMLFMSPILGGLKLGSEWLMVFLPGDGAAAHAAIAEDGSWVLQMPVPAWIARLDSTQRLFGRTSPNASMVKVRSLKVPIPARFPVLFTVSLPFFWALWSAAPGSGKWLRLAAGSALLALIGVLSLVFYGIYLATDTLHAMPTGAGRFLPDVLQYAEINVIPYAGPVLLALGLHDGLRKLIFSGEAPAEEPHPEPNAARAGRGRYR